MTESNGRYLESRSDSEDEGWIPAERSLAHSHCLGLDLAWAPVHG